MATSTLGVERVVVIDRRREVVVVAIHCLFAEGYDTDVRYKVKV